MSNIDELVQNLTATLKQQFAGDVQKYRRISEIQEDLLSSVMPLVLELVGTPEDAALVLSQWMSLPQWQDLHALRAECGYPDIMDVLYPEADEDVELEKSEQSSDENGE